MKVKKQILSSILVLIMCICSLFTVGCLNNEDDSAQQNTDITQNDDERDDENNNTDNNQNNDNNNDDNGNNENNENNENNNDENSEIKIIGFGDSISAGYALEGSDMYNAYVSYVNGDAEINTMCFTNVLANSLNANYQTVNVKSYAQSGDKTSDLINKLNDSTGYPDLESDVDSADIITLCIGANNVLGVALDKMADYFAGAVTDTELDELFAQGVEDFKNDYTNTIIPYLTQGSAKVYVMTIYDPYLYFNFEEITVYSSNEYMAILAKAYIGTLFNNLKSKAMGYMDEINEYIKSQEYQNVVVVDVDSSFKELSQEEYRSYINANSSQVVIDLDATVDFTTSPISIKDTSAFEGNINFDPHPTLLGQQYIANLFLESINNVNN